MKILYVTEYNVGGGAKAVLDLALSSSGFAEVGFIGIGFDLVRYKEIVSFESKAKRPISLSFLWYYWKALNSFNPDIVHANGMFTGLITLINRYFKKGKFKIIMTLHHTSKKFRFHFFVKRMISFLNRVDVIHYLTEYQRGIYLKFGLNPDKFIVIPNITSNPTYTDGEVSALRTKLLDDTSSESLIVYVGRLVESKQLHVFIDVIKKINQSDVNVGGIIVGKGDQSYTNKLHRISSELDIASKIVFAGFTTKPELYIKASDFCFFPTLHDEALPLFILESFSQQKTIVVSNHQSISNIVENYVDSIVSDKHTTDAYAVKCIELIENPQLLKKLERGARDKYDTFYKPEKVIDEFKKMYLEMIKE